MLLFFFQIHNSKRNNTWSLFTPLLEVKLTMNTLDPKEEQSANETQWDVFPSVVERKMLPDDLCGLRVYMITLWLLTNILNFGILQYATLKISCHVSLVGNETTTKQWINVNVIVSMELHKLLTVILVMGSKIYYNNVWVSLSQLFRREGKLYS